MKNKKGYTLVELLAVIVILAIIALIAVPKILSMIENAKKSAAVDSVYGYIEAIENYQASEMLKGNKGLIEGVYNITEDTTIDNVKYKRLKDLVKVKGSSPTFGKVGITKNGTVGTADLCLDNYLVTYQNKKAEVLPGGCENLGITLTYNISSENWEASKILEILYPEGKYEYYYKLESGKAKIGEEELIIGEEIKVETNTVNIELLANSKIAAWMVKNGEKISTRTYEETKIENVEIGTVKVSTTASYPTLTHYGIVLETMLTLDYEKQEGTSPYYSVDNGENWIKYTKSVKVSGTSVQAKLIRDESKREGNVVTNSISTATDALGINAYDGDESTSFDTTTNKILNVDSSMSGKKINIYGYVKSSGGTNNIYIEAYNSNDEMLSQLVKGRTSSGTMTFRENFDIPNGTTYIKFYTKSKTSLIYELKIIDNPVINVESVYPIITNYGINKGYNMIDINYFSTGVKKEYKIDDGDWIEYPNKKIKLNLDQTIYARSFDKNGVESTISEYTSVLPSDALGVNAYDGNESTSFDTTTNKILKVDSTMNGKKVNIYGYVKSSGGTNNIYIEAYNSNNEMLSQLVKGRTSSGTMTFREDFEIPNGTTYIKFYTKSSSSLIYEIRHLNEPQYKVISNYTKITPDKVIVGYSDIEINYFDTSVEKVYKINDGEWKNYNSKIKLEYGDTLYSKGKDKDGVETPVSSYTSALPSDALGYNAYDDDTSSYFTSSNSKIYLSEDMVGKNIAIKVVCGYAFNVDFYSDTEKISSTNYVSTTRNISIKVPENAKYIVFPSIYTKIYDIKAE